MGLTTEKAKRRKIGYRYKETWGIKGLCHDPCFWGKVRGVWRKYDDSFKGVKKGQNG